MNLIGIDLGIYKVALALFTEDKLSHTQVYEADHDIPRDHQLAEIGSFVSNAALLHNADSVWVEDVLAGNNIKYSLSLAETKGAVLTSLHPLRPYNGCDIRTVNVGTWKKEVIGNGNASKDQVKDYIYVTHPAYAPLCGDDQDLCDAACVGLYGLLITSGAKDLQLTSE